MIQSIIPTTTNFNTKYIDTLFSHWNQMPIQSKGKVGEQIVEQMMAQKGHLVGPRVSSSHDRMIDFKKVEIKTLFESQEENKYQFYGYNPTDDAHYWLLLMVTPDETLKLVKMTRETAAKMRTWESKKSQVIVGQLNDFLTTGEVVAEWSSDEAN